MIGYFDDKHREYIITNMFPRRRLLNYLWNDTYVCRLDQFGCGNSWSVIDGNKRNVDNGVRLLYIKNRETGEYFAANRNYDREHFDKFYCRVGLGYHIIESEYKGVKTKLTFAISESDNILYCGVKVSNIGDENKDLSVYFCSEPELDFISEVDCSADFDKNINGIYYDFDNFCSNVKYKKSFLSSEKIPDAFDVSNEYFKGVYGDFAHPDGLKNKELSSRGITTFSMKYLGAFQYDIILKKGQCFETVIACGFGENYEECLRLAKKHANKKTYNDCLNRLKLKREEEINIFTVQSPDGVFNSMTNIWLKNQISLGKSWGRLYGKGFRDIMQDIAAFVSFDLPAARKKIIDVLKHVYEDGNPIRMFEPDIVAPYNDCGSWIPATILEYLCESGDLSILDEKIPYLKGDSYENSSYDKPTIFKPYVGTAETYSIFDHVKRSMDYLWKSRGKRGLVLFRAGDWNDSLNNVGRKEIGESVWLTLATIKAYSEFIDILNISGKLDLIKDYDYRRGILKQNVLKYGIDGNHLLYGFNDYDEKIGSDENQEAKIFLNPQTWAVLADVADKKMLETFMDEAETRLSCDYGYMQCYPSFTIFDDKMGRISYFKKGICENGSVYNHGVAFKIVADCMLGRGDKAYETFKKMAFDNPNNRNNGVEPYAVSNMYIGPENPYIAGFAPMSWITGTAGWLYRCLTEYICGIRPEFNGLRIDPCLPSCWDNIYVERKFRDCLYKIEIIRSCENQIIFNGKKLNGNFLPVSDAKGENEVKVYFE